MIRVHGKRMGWFFFGLGAAFLVIGILRGEAMTVFSKAVSICLECIGIG